MPFKPFYARKKAVWFINRFFIVTAQKLAGH